MFRSSLVLAAVLLVACSADTESSSTPAAADCFGNCCQSTAPTNAAELCTDLVNKGATGAGSHAYHCTGIPRPGPDGRTAADLVSSQTCASTKTAAGTLLCCAAAL